MSSVIEVDHVTKEFRLGQLTSLGQNVRNGIRRLRSLPVQERAPFKALDDVSFQLKQGEVVGIIGHNGAGKSTLLKLLAGISQPTRGRIRVNGRVAPLIEVGAGLVPEMTGRENILLNASILGMKRAEIRRKFDEIVAFSELEAFIDTPVKRYSSGMQVKLGFSIATSVDVEILIVDEVLAVGDLAFQRKCFDRMEYLIRGMHRTVLLVSHNIRQVERLCGRVLMLEHGAVVREGTAHDVCTDFYAKTSRQISTHYSDVLAAANNNEYASREIEVLAVEVKSNEPLNGDSDSNPVRIRLEFRVKRLLRAVSFGIGIHTDDFLYLATDHSHLTVPIAQLPPGDYSIEVALLDIAMAPGVYGLRLGISEDEGLRTHFYAENVSSLKVHPRVGYNRSWQEGLLLIKTRWKAPLPGRNFKDAPELV